jgi:hypothetical protein
MANGSNDRAVAGGGESFYLVFESRQVRFDGIGEDRKTLGHPGKGVACGDFEQCFSSGE